MARRDFSSSARVENALVVIVVSEINHRIYRYTLQDPSCRFLDVFDLSKAPHSCYSHNVAGIRLLDLRLLR